MIVGGGIIGCSIAWRLAQRGFQVTIADRGRLGAQASWAGAGMLAPGGEVSGPSLWAHRTVESLRLYPGYVRELEAESGMKIDFRICGALELAYTDYEAFDLNRKASSQATLGIRSTSLDPVEVRTLAPALATDGLTGARHYPDDAIVDPRDVIRALKVVLTARGVSLHEETRVDRLTTKSGTTVLAAGAWSGELLPEGVEAPATVPVKGHLVGYHLPPGSLPAILRHGHTYILQRANGFTIAGSTTERVGFNPDVDPATVARLHQRARRYLPALLRASPDESWVGFRPGIEGDTPQVGQVGETNLWLAYGHYRNGILLAPLTAGLIAGGISASLGTG